MTEFVCIAEDLISRASALYQHKLRQVIHRVNLYQSGIKLHDSDYVGPDCVLDFSDFPILIIACRQQYAKLGVDLYVSNYINLAQPYADEVAVKLLATAINTADGYIKCASKNNRQRLDLSGSSAVSRRS